MQGTTDFMDYGTTTDTALGTTDFMDYGTTTDTALGNHRFHGFLFVEPRRTQKCTKE